MNPWSEPNDSARVMTGSRMAAIEKLEPRVSLTAVGYRPQEPSIASSPEDTRLAICQFEFGMRNRINAVERLASASKHFVFAQASDESRSVGVTPIRHFELPRKLPRKCPAAPDPRRSLATIACRPIRVRHPYFFWDLAQLPSFPDRYRSSQNIAN